MKGEINRNVSRDSFGENFSFGCATSAYQVEGAWDVGGKSESIWDRFATRKLAATDDGKTACVAVDHYNRFKEDVALMKKLGFNSYRFSISWTRILPRGRLSGGLCKPGIQFYNNLIDELLASGIEPYATLFHWDLPQCLEDEYNGFLDNKIVKDFGEFAEVCFFSFGDRVKHWITLNEPWAYCVQGYVNGAFPPNRGKIPRSEDFVYDGHANMCVIFGGESITLNHRTSKSACQSDDSAAEGNPGTEPYIAAHHFILAHAYAVWIYKEKYQIPQKGEIGMTNVAIWYEPYKKDDVEAASTALDFVLGWFLQPLATGEYPKSMREKVGDRLPKFSEKQKLLVKGSYDFLGINYYTSAYATKSCSKLTYGHYLGDAKVATSPNGEDGKKIGDLCPGHTNWLHIYPEGIYKVLKAIKQRYFGEKDEGPVIYITENGATDGNDDNLPNCLFDFARINYHRDHLYYIKKALNDGVKVKGYFVWSLFDNFEWAEGYDVRFGLIYIEKGRLNRHLKKSAICWMNFLANKPNPWIQENEETEPLKALTEEWMPEPKAKRGCSARNKS